MTARDSLLRAAVYAAFALKGRDEFRSACARVVEIDTLWPIIEYERAIERARAWQLEGSERCTADVELLRSTYGGLNPEVGG